MSPSLHLTFPWQRITPWAVSLAGAIALGQAAAQDPVYSGPQPGETTTPFKVAVLSGNSEATERDPITENKGAPTALVFIHGLERSLVPLLRVVDEYGALRRENLKTELVFLAGDRITGEQRVKAAQGSLKLKAPAGLSVDGAEGPGNYGLNKDCLMTIVVARENKVTASFALVQPGIADAPQVIQAIAKACGDSSPPSIETLAKNQPAMAMRDRGQQARVEKDPFPGAVPTDARLVGLLRQFIRPANDEAAVDRVLAQVKTLIEAEPVLKQQAIDGWTRALHFEKYGTSYARKVGAEFLAQLKAE